MTNSADPDQLASSEKPTDLEIHCLQRQGISEFSRTRDKLTVVLLNLDISCLYQHIGLDKSGYQVNNFLISQRKHMLWILIRSASVRRF